MNATPVPHEPTQIERHRQPAAAYTREQIELIKRTVAQDTNDDELALFLETARRRGLDPFSGQIHAIMRWDGRAGRKVMKIQTGIDGYRKLADETGLIEYVAGPVWTADGTLWVDVWLAEDPPAAARFTVKRKDRSREEARVATWAEYAQRNGQGELTRAWSELSATMIGKVAEAATLRAAFPETLGGIYTVEEMDQAHTPDPETSTAAPAVEIDRPEERRALLDVFRGWWSSISQEEREAVWPEIEPRLYASGSLSTAFAATPVHVLEDLVEAHVPQDATPDAQDDATAAPEAEATGDVDGPAEEPQDAGEDDVVDAEIVDETPDPAEADGQTLDTSGVDLSEIPDRETDEPAYAAWLDAITSAYGDLGVGDVAHLIRKGWVDLEDGRRLVIPDGTSGYRLVDRLERHTGGTYRKTVRATLDGAGYNVDAPAPQVDAPASSVPAEAETLGTPSAPEAPSDDLAERRELLTRWKRAHRELTQVAEDKARALLAVRMQAGAGDDTVWRTFDLETLRTLAVQAERLRSEHVPF